MARALDPAVVGFGGYTSIVTQGCRDVVEDRIVTTGNSVTAAAAVEATRHAIAQLGLRTPRIGVVGAVGNLGTVLAEALAPDAAELLLVGRNGGRHRLERRAAQLRSPGRPPVHVAEELDALRCCDVIVSATNAPHPVVQAEHIGRGPVVICDLAAPGDVAPDVPLRRPDVLFIQGGLVRLPLNQTLRVGGMRLPPGRIYGCLAETLLLGLSDATESLSYGPLTTEGIRRATELAHAHGFAFDLRPPSRLGNAA